MSNTHSNSSAAGSATVSAAVGSTVMVPWSNGEGYSVYRVEDDDGAGPHIFSLLEDHEYQYDEHWRRVPEGRK